MSNNDNVSWLEFQLSADSRADFKVSSVVGEERLGGAYWFDIELVSRDFDVKLDSVLGQPAVLYLSPAGSKTIHYHGVITEMESFFQIADEKMLMRVRLEPSIARLRDNIFNDVFVDDTNGVTLPDLVKQIFEKMGLKSGKDFEIRLNNTPRRRPFIMQYQESDYDFLHRWMEFEGAYYYFEQHENHEKLILIDEVSSLPSTRRTLNYRPIGMYEPELYSNSLQVFNQRGSVYPNDRHIQDYNYRRASDVINVDAQKGSGDWGTVMSFGEDYRTQQEAKHYARLRAQAQAVPGNVLVGEALAAGLAPGMTIEVSGHPRKQLNDGFRLVRLHHKATQSGFGLVTARDGVGSQDVENAYTVQFEAIPNDFPFRLPLKTPRPQIQGYLPAFVDAEGRGKVAQVDRYGRYKVRFPFDYSQHQPSRASAWIRLATPYGGPGESQETGLHFPLLKGAEVMLIFLGGDPDQPVIGGVLPNSLTPSPVNRNNNTLNRLVSSSSNEMHMDDTPGIQGIRMRSSNGSALFVLGSFGGHFGNDDPTDDV